VFVTSREPKGFICLSWVTQLVVKVTVPCCLNPIEHVFGFSHLQQSRPSYLLEAEPAYVDLTDQHSSQSESNYIEAEKHAYIILLRRYAIFTHTEK